MDEAAILDVYLGSLPHLSLQFWRTLASGISHTKVSMLEELSFSVACEAQVPTIKDPPSIGILSFANLGHLDEGFWYESWHRNHLVLPDHKTGDTST